MPSRLSAVLKIASIFQVRKTKTQESGVTLPSPSITSISRSRNQHQKAHVSHSFICLFTLRANMVSAFYRTPGMRVTLRFTAMGSANRVRAGQTHNVKRIEGVSVPLATKRSSVWSVPSLSIDAINLFHTCCLNSSQQPFSL